MTDFELLLARAVQELAACAALDRLAMLLAVVFICDRDWRAVQSNGHGNLHVSMTHGRDQ